MIDLTEILPNYRISTLIAASEKLTEKLSNARKMPATEYDTLSALYRTVENQILITPAETMRQLEWKLYQLVLALDGNDEVSDWVQRMTRSCWVDAKLMAGRPS